MPDSPLKIELDQHSQTPLYEQICQQIRQRIESGRLQPGTVLPTSHALRDELQINYKTAHQAMATLASEGYVTRQARRGTVVKGVPRRGVAGIFSFPEHFSDDGKHEYYRLIMGHLSDAMEMNGRVHRQYLGSNNTDSPNIACEDLLRHLSAGSLCGALLVKRPQFLEQILQQSREKNIPVVGMWGNTDPGTGLKFDYSVGVDMSGYVRSAAKYLAERGCRRVGLIYNRFSVMFHDVASTGDILKECGITHRPEWIIGEDETDEGGYAAASRLPLKELDGLIIEDDVMSLGVDRKLVEAGVRVLADLQVTTFWNTGSRLQLSLPFEKFEIDPRMFANKSLQLMQQAISGERIIQRHLMMTPQR